MKQKPVGFVESKSTDPPIQMQTRSQAKEARLKKIEEDLIIAKQNKKTQKEAEAIRHKEIFEDISNPKIGSNEQRPFIEQALKLIETGDKTKTEEIRKLIISAGLGMKLGNTRKLDKLKLMLDEGYKKTPAKTKTPIKSAIV